MNALTFLFFFMCGVIVGRAWAPKRSRNALIVGTGLPVDRAMRRPELRAAFRADRRRSHGR